MLMLKIIDNHELLLKKLMEQPIGKKTILTSTFYPNKVVYNCGCGSTHAVNNPNLKIVGTALPVKFLLACEDGYTSFVQQTILRVFSCRFSLGDYSKSYCGVMIVRGKSSHAFVPGAV